jgi:hypothetical protein
MLTAEQFIERLRNLLTQIDAVTQLTAQQRRAIRQKLKLPGTVIRAQISVIGASDRITEAVGYSADEMLTMVTDSDRWGAVADELKALWSGIAGANLLRRQTIAIITKQAFAIAQGLIRDPEHADLVPHVEEVTRLKKLTGRRKRPAENVETPETDTAP